jgi:hypothetical protein
LPNRRAPVELNRVWLLKSRLWREVWTDRGPLSHCRMATFSSRKSQGNYALFRLKARSDSRLVACCRSDPAVYRPVADRAVCRRAPHVGWAASWTSLVSPNFCDSPLPCF